MGCERRRTLAQENISTPGDAPQPEITEDVRMDEVNRLRAAIASGTYSVSAEALADKILDHLYEPGTEKP
jgi:flagellar biosynthesis anti-sigma factor FlgM